MGSGGNVTMSNVCLAKRSCSALQDVQLQCRCRIIDGKQLELSKYGKINMTNPI